MLHIVMLSDEDRIITDVVAFDDFKQAETVATELVASFGKNRVQRTSLTVNQLPAFWGLTNEKPANTGLQSDGAKALQNLEGLTVEIVPDDGAGNPTPRR